MDVFATYLNRDVAELGMVLVLSLLIGLERETVGAEKKAFFFGGIRTYPLFAIAAFLLTIVSPDSMIPFAVGLVVLGVFLAQTYYYKVDKDKLGFTTEMAAILTYVLGAVVAKDFYWLAVAITVVVMMLLQLKTPLERLAKRIPEAELFTFLKFLLLTAVIIPIVPSVNLTAIEINPSKTWLIVTAVSAISYGSYLLQFVLKKGRGILLSALIGAVYSSTVTTVVLSKKAKREGLPRLFSGALLMASGVMYLRIAILLYFFSRPLFDLLALPFSLFFLVAVVVGGAYAIFFSSKAQRDHEELQPEKRKNPLELTTAFSFAALFVVIVALTHFVSAQYGSEGIYVLSGIMGVTDVDPFILGLTQAETTSVETLVAAHAIIIATASNNLAKGVYSLIYADRSTGVQSMTFLALLSALSLTGFWLIGM